MVKIETRYRIPIWERLGEFNGMSSQSHLPHCRVLPPGELNVMIPELHVTLQGAATGRIQWHVIPEPHITLQGGATWWIYCHDSRATCHIAGCSHVAKSMSWSCYIAGCKNFIRPIEKNRFFAICYLFIYVFKCSFGFDEQRLSYCLRYTCFNCVWLALYLALLLVVTSRACYATCEIFT